jgi:hypothetical protein
MSWTDIDNDEIPEDVTESQVKGFSSLCYHVFEGNENGQKLLSLLNVHFETPVCPPDKDPSYGFFREGQNNIIRQIKKGIEFHKKHGGEK